jgi:hypothetical protein
MFCSPRQRASYEANQCLKRAPDFAAIDDATCGRVASELPVASALLIWRVIAHKRSLGRWLQPAAGNAVRRPSERALRKAVAS